MAILTIPTNNLQSIYAQGVLGRSLVLATSFESDCRMIALALKLKDPAPLEDEAQFAKFLEKIACDNRLIDNQNRLVQGLTLSTNFQLWLTSAREARNFIAHEAADGFEMMAENETWDNWLEEIHARVQEIAIGKQIFAILWRRIMKQRIPTSNQLTTYAKEIVAWVMSNRD